MKLRKNERSLNYAKLTEDEVQNLQIRGKVLAKARAELADMRARVAMLEDADNAYKRQLIQGKNLRKSSSGFVFDYKHGYVHRPNVKPWETKAPAEKPSTNGRELQTMRPAVIDAVFEVMP